MTTPSKPHPDYTIAAQKWKRVRDVQSEDKVKLERTTYLPALNSQIDGSIEAKADYTNYLTRAQVHGAPGRMLDGLVGAVLRKEPTVEGVPDDSAKMLSDAAGRAFEPLSQLIQQQVRDLASVGRYALLVDKGQDPEGLPYLLKIDAEQVTFWSEETIDGRDVPTTIVIRETYEKPKEGDTIGNETEIALQYRVLRLGLIDPMPEHLLPVADLFAGAPSRVYWQEVWRDDVGTKSTIHAVYVPTKQGGKFWEDIPCDIVNARGGISLKVEEPPMDAMALVVLSHYRNSADYEWGMHLTATPQPWASGFDVPQGTKLVTGCGYAWITPQTGANVQYLEFSGAGLAAIAQAMASKEHQMAVLGTRMLEAPKNAAEAAGTVRLRQSGERSVLAGIAHNVSVATTRAVQRWLAWQSPRFDTPETMATVKVTLATDFDAVPLDPAELTALVASLQAGTISWETFAHNIRRGELLPPGVSDDDERKRIQAGAPGRSRKDELALLQTDVREGRISTSVYLQQIQALGMLPGVDVAAMSAEIEGAKSRSMEAQMRILREVEAERDPKKPPAEGDGVGNPPQPPKEKEQAA